LDAVEDDANEDHEEESAEGGAQCDQHNNTSRVVVACVIVSLRKRSYIGTDGGLPPDLRGLVMEENRLAMVPLWPSIVEARMKGVKLVPSNNAAEAFPKFGRPSWPQSRRTWWSSSIGVLA
jgi:hypothetical protein